MLHEAFHVLIDGRKDGKTEDVFGFLEDVFSLLFEVFCCWSLRNAEVTTLQGVFSRGFGMEMVSLLQGYERIDLCRLTDPWGTCGLDPQQWWYLQYLICRARKIVVPN